MNQALIDSIKQDLDARHANDVHKNAYVPFETFGAEMISKLPKVDGSILVVSDAGLLIAVLRRLRVNGQKLANEDVTFLCHTAPLQKLGQELSVKTVLIEYNDLSKLFKGAGMGMKFDIAIMNPPYGALHLPILKMVVESMTPTGVILSIQPIRWLQDPLWRAKKNSDARKMQSTLDGKIESIEVVSAKRAIEIFGIERFTMDLGVIMIKNAGGTYNYRTLSEKPFGVDISSLTRFFDSKSGFKLETYDGKMKNFVPMMIIAGGSDRGEFQNWITHRAFGYVANGVTHMCKYGNNISIEQAWANNRHISSGKVSNLPVKSFNTSTEAKNFFDFIRLEAFRFFVYVTTLDVNLQSQYLPVPAEDDSFETAWTNERFYEYYKIDAEGQKIINNTMKDKSSDPYGWDK